MPKGAKISVMNVLGAHQRFKDNILWDISQNSKKNLKNPLSWFFNFADSRKIPLEDQMQNRPNSDFQNFLIYSCMSLEQK